MLKWCAWLMLVAAVVPGGCGGGGTPAVSAGYVVWPRAGDGPSPSLLPFSVPPRPAKGQTVRDPVYHTQVARVTDRTADGYQSDAILNEYAKMSPENSDGTRVILRGTDNTWYLYDVSTFAMVRQINFGAQEPEPRWDPADPNVLYYVDGPGLWRCNLSTDARTLVHDFSQADPNCVYVRSHYEGDSSLDGRYWCLALDDANWQPFAVVCYDKQQDTVVGRLDQVPGDFDFCTMSMTGQYCLVESGTTAAVSYHRDFSNAVPLPAGTRGHGDCALDSAGKDVYVYQNVSTDYIAMADMETGVETNLLPIPFDVSPDLGLHFAANCAAKPGWVLVSTYGQFTEAHGWMEQMLFMVQLQANPGVWRVVQTQCRQGADNDYFGEAFATINRAGTRIWWGTNWTDLSLPHRYETYLATLPSTWDADVVALIGH